MNIGKVRWSLTAHASRATGLIPTHNNTGRGTFRTVSADDPQNAALKDHFEYFLSLGEVRATRTMAEVVDGVQVSQVNCNDGDIDMVYLPISMECCQYYI